MILNDSGRVSILFLFPLHSSAMIFNQFHKVVFCLIFFMFFRTVSWASWAAQTRALNIAEHLLWRLVPPWEWNSDECLQETPPTCIYMHHWNHCPRCISLGKHLESFRPLTASEPLKMWPHTLKRTPQTLHCAQNHKPQLSQLQKIAKQRNMKEWPGCCLDGHDYSDWCDYIFDLVI